MRQIHYSLLKYAIVLFVVGFIAADEQYLARVYGQSETESASASRSVNIHDAIEALRESRLVEALQLSEPRAQTVIQKMRQARAVKKEYLLQRYALENELDTLFDPAERDATKIAAILEQLEQAKAQYYQKLLQNDEELRHLLTQEEQARYVLFQREFNQKLKEVITKIRQQSVNQPQKPSEILRQEDAESVIRRPR